jgi:uncharacterized protein YkwD
LRIGLAAAITALLLLASVQAAQKTYADNPVAIMSLGVNLGAENVVNSPLFLSATISNVNNFAQPFVAVFEVRDAEDVTVFARLEAGVLAPGGQQAPRTFWVPDAAGEYTARAFVISGISKPEVLSAARSTQFVVQESSQPEPPVVFSLNESPDSSLLYQLKQHALDRINKDRDKFGLEPLYFSYNIAAQKHAEDMLGTKVLSHWMTSGESPYMAYSRYGGLGMVSQNVAMSGSPGYYADCTSGGHLCDRLDPFEQVDLHQYGMVYTDSECCNDSHRDNILDPFHTHVSIGIAYDDYTFVMVQNFENNYLELEKPPAKRANYVELVGDTPRGRVSAINVHYDAKPAPEIYDQNKDRQSYGLGELVATVVPPGSGSSPAAIVADVWDAGQQSVEIGFSIDSINEKRGVYTIVVIFEDRDGNVFPVMSYSLL